MIVIWYNHNYGTFYSKVVRRAIHDDYYKVGYKNQYNHEIVAMYYIEKNKVYQCNSYWDYKRVKKSFRDKVIDRLIGLLNRFKKGE